MTIKGLTLALFLSIQRVSLSAILLALAKVPSAAPKAGDGQAFQNSSVIE